jgi:hypothetical protein
MAQPCHAEALTVQCAPRMHPMVLACLLLCVVVFTTGCSRSLRYYTDVDSIALSDQSVGKRYLLFPGNQGGTPDDLEFLEYARYIEAILMPLGFVKASSDKDADIAVMLSYGLGSPQTHQFSSSIPVYGQTGVSSASTMGTITPVGGGMASYSGNTTIRPSCTPTRHLRGSSSGCL